MYLFVYGTLQRELDTDMSRFLVANSKTVAKGYILGKLYKISWFPGAILTDDSSCKVYGTVFKLKDNAAIFDVLDAYEGCNTNTPNASLFIRQRITVFLENNNTLTSWVYLYNQNIANSEQITSGDFLKYSTS